MLGHDSDRQNEMFAAPNSANDSLLARLSEQLKMSDDQLKRVQLVTEEGTAQIEKAAGFRLLWDSKDTPTVETIRNLVEGPEFRAAKEKAPRTAREAWDAVIGRIEAVLNDEQRANYRKVLGKPFDLTRLQFEQDQSETDLDVQSVARALGLGGGQRADPGFVVRVARPTFTNLHPRVAIDEAHHNFHTAVGRYKPFADLMTNDGFLVSRNTEALDGQTLERCDILVVANATAANAGGNDGAPSSAFTEDECSAVQRWVWAGGALLLITDHEPFGSASVALAQRFGIVMNTSGTIDPANTDQKAGGLVFTRESGLVVDHLITLGRDLSERINRVETFYGQAVYFLSSQDGPQCRRASAAAGDYRRRKGFGDGRVSETEGFHAETQSEPQRARRGSVCWAAPARRSSLRSLRPPLRLCVKSACLAIVMSGEIIPFDNFYATATVLVQIVLGKRLARRRRRAGLQRVAMPRHPKIRTRDATAMSTTSTATDRAEINRRNAQKSTGPKTPEGKSRSRFNAVKHGMSAKTLVLPGEDPEALQQRVEAWTADLAPRNDVEQYLVDRAVLASWQLDRADRADTARLTQIIRTATADETLRQDEEAIALGARLFWDRRGPLELYPHYPLRDELLAERKPRVSFAGIADDPDDPARLVLRLESTAAGCRWLLDRWAELRELLEQDLLWQSPDRLKAIRLLGKQPMDAADDADVTAIYMACWVLDPRVKEIDAFDDVWNELLAGEANLFRRRLEGRHVEEFLPDDTGAAKALLLEIVGESTRRLEALSTAHRERAEADAGQQAARLSFDDSKEGERLRRFQTSCGRSLHKALDALLKIRRASDKAQARAAELADTGASDPGVATRARTLFGEGDDPAPAECDPLAGVASRLSEPENEPNPEAADHRNPRNEPIYERGSVKRGGADSVIGSSRTSPFAVGFGRSGPSQPACGRSGCASRSHPLSLRPREILPRLAVCDALADVT
jgi:hypothetical protein